MTPQPQARPIPQRRGQRQQRAPWRLPAAGPMLSKETARWAFQRRRQRLRLPRIQWWRQRQQRTRCRLAASSGSCSEGQAARDPRLREPQASRSARRAQRTPVHPACLWRHRNVAPLRWALTRRARSRGGVTNADTQGLPPHCGHRIARCLRHSSACCGRFRKGRKSTSSSTAVIPEAVTGVSWHSPDEVEVVVADASHRQRRSASRFRNPGGALVGEGRQARSRTVGIEGGG